MENFLKNLGIKPSKEIEEVKIEKVIVSDIEETEKPIPRSTGKSHEEWGNELDQAFDSSEEILTSPEINFLNVQLRDLNEDLNKAVESENYEKAAQVRDKIQGIKAKFNKD